MIRKPGLRLVKKEATERALAHAAFELAQERGLDGMVIDDVVERAGYSRRTFANHFTCKEEAVAMAVFPYHGVEEFTALLDALPEGTTPLDIMFQFLTMQVTLDFLGRMRQLMVLSGTYRTLEPYLLVLLRRLETELEAVLSEIFPDQYPPGYHHLLTGAVSEALLPVVDGTVPVQIPGDPPTSPTDAISYDEYLKTMFSYLRHGF